MRRRSWRTWAGVLAALALQVAVWWFVVHYFKTRRIWYGFYDCSDIGLYENYAQRFAQGLLPYRGVAFEYPPLAVLLMTLPAWFSDWVDYQTAFAAEMIVLYTVAAALACAAVARRSNGFARPVATAVASAVLTLFAGPIIANRFDAAVALDIAFFVYCMSRRAWRLAGACLGLGFALKLTPALLLPLIFVVAPRLRQAAAAGVAFLVAAGAVVVPHLLRSGTAILFVLRYHGDRPLQIESLYSTPLLLRHALAHGLVTIGNSYGSQSVIAPGAGVLARASVWVMGVCLLGFYVLLWSRRGRLRQSLSEVVLAAMGLLLIFVCTSKVFSPQFMIWLLPLAALLATSRRVAGRVASCLVAAATLLSQLDFPSRYWDLVALHTGPIVLVSIRNLILLTGAIFVLVLFARRSDAPSNGTVPEVTKT